MPDMSRCADDAMIIAACRASADGLLTAMEQVTHHYHEAIDEELMDNIGCEHRDIATTSSPLDAVLSLVEMLRAASNIIADSCDDAEIVGWQLRCWSLLPRITTESDQREQDYLQARIGTVRGLLDQLPAGDVVSRVGLESHLAEMQGEASHG